MTQGHASKLSFTIEESVWLDKGQEISEVISMSLEPEITIEERNEFVQIKGGLKLCGEFRPVSEAKTKSTGVEDDDPFSFRSIHEMSVNDQGIGEVHYFFPIDVTIPANRIRHLEDIFVQVDSFDYDLPEKNCIQLTADISISGISIEEQQTARGKTEPILNQEETSFAYEAAAEISQPSLALNHLPTEESIGRDQEEQLDSQKVELSSIQKEQEEQRVTKQQQEQNVIEPKEEQRELKQQNETRQKSEQKEIEQEKHETKQDERNIIQQEKKIEEKTERKEVGKETKEGPIGQENPAKKITGKNDEIVNSNKQENVANISQIAEKNEETAEPKKQENQADINQITRINEETAKLSRQENPADSIEAHKTEPEEAKVTKSSLKDQTGRPQEAAAKAKTRKNENALYLTKMLSNEEEKFSKLKMCIIQQNESIDTIAERYNISPTQIIRVNRLESEHLKEGQILYIPVGKK